MQVVRPVTITGDMIDDFSVPWPAAVATGFNYHERFRVWLSGTTYSAGTLVAVPDPANYYGGATRIFKSLQSANTNHEPTASPSWWEEVGASYPSFYNDNVYRPGDRVIPLDDETTAPADGFDIIYECIQSTEEQQSGLADTEYWTPVAVVNHLAAFDGTNEYATSWADEIQYTIEAGTRIDTIGLMSMRNVANVNITVEVGVTEVYNEDFDLATGTGIDPWYDWFFDPAQSVYDLAVNDLAILNLPNDATAVYTITLTGDGIISVGEIVMGQARNIGASQYDMRLGITDYSKIQADDFGVRSIVQRAYVKKLSGEVFVEARDTSYVYNLLASLRATPILLIGSDTHSASVQYGMLKSWGQEIAFPSHSRLSLEFEGL